MDVDVDQFLADCKANDIEFDPNFLNFLTKIDAQCAKIKEVYFKFVEIIEVDQMYKKDIERLHANLGEIEQVFNRLRSNIESHVEEFTLLREMRERFNKIFTKVEYVYDLEYSMNIAGGLKKDFIVLDLENLQSAIEVLQSIIQFRSINESSVYLPSIALEIEEFCKVLGSLNHQFIPNVILLKLPPKLLQLYQIIERITKRIRMFSSCMVDDYLSSYITNALKSYNKIQKKFSSGNKDTYKIRGSSGIKMSFFSLEDLERTIKSHFLLLF